MANKRIVISKMGSDHVFEDKNNQDFVISVFNLKMVLDGCGSCPFSEIGVRLFAQFFTEEVKYLHTETEFIAIVNKVFARLTQINPSDEFFYNNFCFTILACMELEEEFVVMACGDGYLLTQSKSQVNAKKLEDGEYPRYYIYNYVQEKEKLQEYQDGVGFTKYSFSKTEYDNVGVATDGFRFFENLNIIEKNNLFSYFQDGKRGKLGMLINRNANVFKDDISICF